MTDSQQIDLLEGVLARTGELMRSLPSPLPAGPTPCAEFDVPALLDHMCRWVRVFAETSNGRSFDGDPEALTLPDDPGAVFTEAASAVLAGWRAGGIDRKVPSFSGGEIDGSMSFGITLLEYLAHGWDLARATNRSVVYPDAAAEAALTAAHGFLLPEYRGPGMFDAEVAVAADAPAIDRLVAFLGRDPNWTPAIA